MYGLPWVTILSLLLRQFGNYFHLSWVKILAESAHEWQKLSSRLTHTLFYFLHAILCPQPKNLLKTIINCSFHHCQQGRSFLLRFVTSHQLICDVMQSQGIHVVTYSLIVLTHAIWCKVDLHWWITTVNINFPPPSIHGLVCQKTQRFIHEYVSFALALQNFVV